METSRERSNSPRGRASDGAPPLPPSILRNKTAGPINKKPGRIVGLITGAKRAIEEDLRRPLLLPSPPGGSKAGWSSCIKPADQVELSERATDREGVDGIDGDAAESVEEPPENAEGQEIPGTAVSKETPGGIAESYNEATEKAKVADVVAAPEEVDGNLDEQTGDELPDDQLPLAPPAERCSAAASCPSPIPATRTLSAPLTPSRRKRGTCHDAPEGRR